MTVHMVRVLSHFPADASIEDIREAVEEWVNENDEVLTSQRTSVQRVESMGEIPEHLTANFRFALTTTKDDLLTAAENALQQAVDWYIVGYHGCNHDAGSPSGGCSWDDRRTWGPVPNEVNL